MLSEAIPHGKILSSSSETSLRTPRVLVPGLAEDCCCIRTLCLSVLLMEEIKKKKINSVQVWTISYTVTLTMTMLFVVLPFSLLIYFFCEGERQ